jgi:hypothetical protein
MPDTIDPKLIERTLIAIQGQLATLGQRVGDVQDDQKAMREQVDVIVMTALRLERGMTALRQDAQTALASTSMVSKWAWPR